MRAYHGEAAVSVLNALSFTSATTYSPTSVRLQQHGEHCVPSRPPSGDLPVYACAEYYPRKGQGMTSSNRTPTSERPTDTLVGIVQVYRGVQYFARFFAWLLLSRGYKIQAARWDALKSHLALGRKRESPVVRPSKWQH